ncbi:hypothetical protein GH714_011030 [Hevea brasiliensis]|uniref:EGF-like domain-containing protein n=1 Tax=Hevea brasiliensis TaxID=3981 RepID=A0A6A6LJH8_HEVBR|nr:hypothetical protein GH714_011030 [Hevea brasiliensis]
MQSNCYFSKLDFRRKILALVNLSFEALYIGNFLVFWYWFLVCYPIWVLNSVIDQMGFVCTDGTIDFQCGNASPPSPPPSVPVPPPTLNLTNTCNLIWCADGSCLPNGTRHTCQCNGGSANLVNNGWYPGFICTAFLSGYFGADCSSLGLGPPVSSPAPPPSGSNGNVMPPPTSTPDMAGNVI